MRKVRPYAIALAVALALTSCSDPVTVEAEAVPTSSGTTIELAPPSTSSSTTSTTAPPTTVETTTSTTAPPAPVTSTSQVTPATPTPPTTVWIEPEPIEEPPAYEPAYEPSGAGCVIPAYICQRESGMSYTALNPSSGAGGMYQFMPSTWNAIARAIAPEWVGTPPHTAPPYVQDQFAIYLWDGGRGCSHWSACG